MIFDDELGNAPGQKVENLSASYRVLTDFPALRLKVYSQFNLYFQVLMNIIIIVRCNLRDFAVLANQQGRKNGFFFLGEANLTNISQ